MSGNLLSDISDHLPNFLVINKISTLKKDNIIYKRNYTKINQEKIVNELQKTDWSYLSLNCDNDPSIIFDSIYDKVIKVIDTYAPMEKISKKEAKFNTKPWITTALKTSIRIKNILYWKFLKNNSAYNHFKYKTYRNKLSILLKVTKRNNYQNYFRSNSSNLKKIWLGIKEIVNLNKKGSRGIPAKLKEGDLEITNVKEIANKFNKFFSLIGVNVGNSVNVVDKSPLEYIDNSYPDSFFLSPVTSEEIVIEINNLNTSKSKGPYSIPISLLKVLHSNLCKPLEILYNCSFNTGIVPNKLKLGKIIPLFKAGCQSCINCYRPIALLSVFDKILEKLMYKRLIRYIENKNILFKNQFGFRSNHSTIQAILSITDKIQQAIENKKYSSGIFLDLSKAFDTVDHKILLEKLECYGICGIVKN